MRKFLFSLNQFKLKPAFLFFGAGIISTIWFLIRVIPKPSRAGYPCMKAVAPVMSGFVIYLIGIIGSAYAFKKVRRNLAETRYLPAFAYILSIGLFSALMISSDNKTADASALAVIAPPDGANNPMGEGKGVYPGRVIWAWDRHATDSTCNNTYGNRYYLTKNFNQPVIDQMIYSSIVHLTGTLNVKAAWDSIFTKQNQKKYSLQTSYSPGETIFIKINQTTANWHTNSDYSDRDGGNGDLNAGACETSPPVIMSILRQLIDSFGVAQENIYIGDPMSHIIKYNYSYWHSAYPNVKYCDQSIDNGRYQITASGTTDLNFSDQGYVMTAINYSDQELFREMVDAKYMINIANLKPHVRAGITLCAKNHFGSPTHSSAGNFHSSLVNTLDAAAPDNAPNNTGYKKYRVQVDLMGSQYLGGNTMLSIVDGLWAGGPNEIEIPRKWKMTPFNNNWANSVFMSIDQVALESVCFDFLRTEYNGINQPEKNPNWNGVDDYLHQAADTSNWPNGLSYDPDGSGIHLKSLGVHEHWKDALKKSYSRNLNFNKGIELVSIPASLVYNVAAVVEKYKMDDFQLRNYPNPFSESTQISYFLKSKSDVSIGIYDLKGALVSKLINKTEPSGLHHTSWSAGNFTAGIYLCRIAVKAADGRSVQTIKMVLNR